MRALSLLRKRQARLISERKAEPGGFRFFNLSKKRALSTADIERLPYSPPTYEIQDPTTGVIWVAGYHDIGDAPW